MTADTSARKNTEPRPTVSDLRRRARNRLIGSALLVLAAIVLFGFLFDSKPRNPTEEVDFSIPEQGQVKPIGTAEGQREIADLSSSSDVAVPLEAPAAEAAESSGDVDVGRVDDAESLSPDEAFVGTWDDDTVAQERDAAARARVNAAQAEQQVQRERAAREKATREKAQQEKEQRQEKEREQAKRKAEQKKAEAAKAEAEAARVQVILSGEKKKRQQKKERAPKQSVGKTAASDTGVRYIVQFGSLKDPVRAEAVRAEVAAKGLSAYTQTANTSKGTYTRLRSGPYSSKAAADAAAAKIKAMGHPVLVKRSQ